VLPHGLAADENGNICFTASFQGYIGKLDPKTGTITEYHLPDPAASDRIRPVLTGLECSGSPCKEQTWSQDWCRKRLR